MHWLGRQLASQDGSSSPSATMTAGPVSQARPASRVTVRPPPGTLTSQAPSPLPLAAAAAAAAATAPVPHERVSPEPRSCTRMATLRGPVTRTSSTLPPSGNCPGSSSGAWDRSNEASGTSTRQARCGFPTDTRSPGYARPARTAFPGPSTATAPISTVTPPPAPIRIRRGPDRVPTVNSGPAARPWRDQVAREHPDPVAAHLRHAAVGVAVVHEPLRPVRAAAPGRPAAPAAPLTAPGAPSAP